MGQCGPHVQFFAACLGVTIALGVSATWCGASVFTVGADVGTGVGGIGCRAGTLCKLSCCKFMHCHWYGCCGKHCCLHLGGCGSNCWSHYCGCGLVQDSYFIPSFGYHYPVPFVACLWVGAFLTLVLVLGWTGHDCVCCGWFVSVDWVWDWGLDFGPSFPSNSR